MPRKILAAVLLSLAAPAGADAVRPVVDPDLCQPPDPQYRLLCCVARNRHEWPFDLRRWVGTCPDATPANISRALQLAREFDATRVVKPEPSSGGEAGGKTEQAISDPACGPAPDQPPCSTDGSTPDVEPAAEGGGSPGREAPEETVTAEGQRDDTDLPDAGTGSESTDDLDPAAPEAPRSDDRATGGDTAITVSPEDDIGTGADAAAESEDPVLPADPGDGGTAGPGGDGPAVPVHDEDERDAERDDSGGEPSGRDLACGTASAPTPCQEDGTESPDNSAEPGYPGNARPRGAAGENPGDRDFGDGERGRSDRAKADREDESSSRPGNDRARGGAGESPGGGDFGSGSRGRSDARSDTDDNDGGEGDDD